MEKGLETISTFSLSHLIYVGIALVLIVLLNLILFKAKGKARKVVIFTFSLLGFFVLVGTMVYNYLTTKNFDIFANLPITLCGVVFIFGMLFSLTNVSSMKSFVGYAGIFAGLYGLLALPNALVGSLSFDLKTILYFIPYIISLTVAVSMFTLKLARPTFKNMGISIITLILVACFVHVINVAFTIYGVTDSANYFMTLSPSRDMVSTFIYKYIPASFVYLFAYLVVFVILTSVISLFSLGGKKEKVETYEIEDKKEKKSKLKKAESKKTEQTKEESNNEAVKTEIEEVEEKIEENTGNKDEWEDVIPESILKEQAKKEQAESSIDDIIIKDDEVEQKASKNDKKHTANVFIKTDKKIEEKNQSLETNVESSEKSKLEETKTNIKKDYQTYEVKEKTTQVQRKYSFAETDIKRKNDPTLGVSSTKRNVSQNAEFLKFLRARIDKLGK